MKSIILLSDTHSNIDVRLEKHLNKADEIWHAGDIGNRQIIEYLETFAKLRVVYGNIDDHKLRAEFPEDLFFELEGFQVFMTHIGSYPPRYNKTINKKLDYYKPSIFICGHSHILKVIYDKKRACLHLNPGAIGIHGFHKVKTCLKFNLYKGNISDMEIIEYPRNSKIK